jgi:small subunit ribosomal protein S4
LLRQQYDLRGRQLGRVLAEAAREPGETGSKLIELLEQRLDALVWRAGFASSIHQARLLIRHNHFTVDGSKVDLPSYRLQPGQTLEVRESRRAKLPVDGAAGQRGNLGESPAYLDVQQAGPCATLTREPRRDEVPMPGHLQLVLAGGPR